MTLETIESLWVNFGQKHDLSQEKIDIFKKYVYLLIEWNKEVNLTNITEIPQIIAYHFEDSLSISKFVDFNSIKSICDIGTGGGFPAIPIKIKFPHLKLVLIEVNAKKRAFLETLINELKLENIEIYPLDWRTFLRKTDYSADVFFARASLHTDELLRMFKPGSPYKDSQLVYWASKEWIASEKDKAFLKKEEMYIVGNKRRKLIFFGRK
jgi:16S rRNA (guanine527-N7)-methyltransferase